MKSHLLMQPALFAAACLLAAGASCASAQDGNRWFKVELLVFGQGQGSAGETWEATPKLAYPDTHRFLVEPELVAANQAEHARAYSELDAYGRQIISDAEPARNTSTPTGEGATPGLDQPSTPTPFRVLPASQREFRGKAAYMQRTGRYTTLFHQAWLQPVTDQTRALPIVLDRSGDTGEWSRLQGSITLYLSRYLHLKTNLWLNTQGDYLSGEWRMPPPPMGPPSLILENATTDNREGWIEPQASSNETGTGETPGGDELEQGPVYPYRHAVLLQQKRRMRSNEVHYLDHPLIGVVIKLTPLSGEDLPLFGQAEQSGNYPPL